MTTDYKFKSLIIIIIIYIIFIVSQVLRVKIKKIVNSEIRNTNIVDSVNS